MYLSKAFWRAIKDLEKKTSYNKKLQKTQTFPQRYLGGITDQEKSEIFYKLKKKQQKSHNSFINNSKNNEKETKAVLETVGDSEQLSVVVTRMNLKKWLKNWQKMALFLKNHPWPSTQQTQRKFLNFLQEILKSVKILACIPTSSSMNNPYVQVIWKESQIKMIPKQSLER